MFIALLSLAWIALMAGLVYLVWNPGEFIEINGSTVATRFQVLLDTTAEQTLATIGLAALMLPAVILVVASYIRGRIYTVLKHPMLAGVKLWAAAHLIANGDLGSIILFGSFLGWAVFDRISLKSRADRGAPPIPVGGVSNDAIAVVAGVLVYLALGLVFHPVVIGVAVFGV